VGTRHPTAEALQKTRTVSHALAEKGIIIISGLAFGIDCEAHKEALKARAFTVGISGVKAGQIYPKENSRLYTNLYNSGLVICENSPVAKIMKNSFPSRNRIISALSDAILMMEAPAKSGAIITAEHALSNKKAVFVPFGDEKYNEGGNALLKKGASLLSSHENVLEHLTNLNKDFYTEKTAPTLQEELRDLENNNISLDKNVSSDMETTNDLISISIPDELSENEKKIYVFISSKDSVSADSIFMELDIPRNEIVASLSMLEICGYIIRIPGDKWKLL
jgi:DNA processing protein